MIWSARALTCYPPAQDLHYSEGKSEHHNSLAMNACFQIPDKIDWQCQKPDIDEHVDDRYEEPASILATVRENRYEQITVIAYLARAASIYMTPRMTTAIREDDENRQEWP